MSKHKSKRARLSNTSTKQVETRPVNRNFKSTSQVPGKRPVASRKQHKQEHPVLQPFTRFSDVLLVGEGDFSFARALSNGIPVQSRAVENHADETAGLESRAHSQARVVKAQDVYVRTITATSLDSAEEVRRKYPAVGTWLDGLKNDDGEVDAEQGHENGYGTDGVHDENDFEGFSPPVSLSSSPIPSSPTASSLPPSKSGKPLQRSPVRIHHGVDATKLHTYKAVRHTQSLPSVNSASFVLSDIEARKGYTHIVFNFPHVGGLSTDRARQTRANQLLLANLFTSSKQLLRQSGQRPRSIAPRKPWEEEASEDDDQTEGNEGAVKDEPDGGRVIVSLFEGDPYDSWDIRALAKSASYEVERSGSFAWELWGRMGYAHARTLGVLRSKNEWRQGHDSGTADGFDAGRGDAGNDLDGAGGEQNEAEDETMGVKQPSNRRKSKQRKAGWKGEQRVARMYVFKLRDSEHARGTTTGKKRRSGHDSDSD